MKKNLVSAIAIASAVVLSAMPVCASSSSTTSNTSSSNVVETTTNEAPAPLVVASNQVSYSTLNGKQAVATNDGARITGDKSELTDKSTSVIVSSVGPQAASSKDAKTAASAKIAEALENYVKATGITASKTFGPYKYQFLKAGVSQWDNFGTYKTAVGVGNAYEGKTVTVYQILKDGSVVATQAVVTNGKVNITLTQAGTIMIAVQ